MKSSKNPSVFLGIPCVIAAVGCASTETNHADEMDPEGLVAGAPEPSQSVSQAWTVSDPANTYFADVTTNGTGCPPGTTSASIAPDGSTFTVVFSTYEASVDPGQFIGVKDCQLGIRLHTPQGFSFSIASFDYAGYVVLETTGMSSTQSAAYYFQGDRLNSARGTTNTYGPYEGEVIYRDEVPLADLVWSPCGAIRGLNVATRLVLRNNPRRNGFGYVNLLSTDGQVSLVFNLNWRRCPP